jgi:hypothetical protein
MMKRNDENRHHGYRMEKGEGTLEQLEKHHCIPFSKH